MGMRGSIGLAASPSSSRSAVTASAAEPRGDGRHRPPGQLADRLEPGAEQPLGRLRLQLQRRHRQPADRRRFVLRGQRLVAGQRMGRPGVPAKASRTVMRRAGHARLDIGGQAPLAAEQMGAAGDVEDQPVGRIQRDHRRVADAAVGQPLEPGPVGRLVALDRLQLRHPRPGVGQRHARLQPE